MLEDSVMAEQILCVIRLIDADLFHLLDGLKEIYCKVGGHNSTKIAMEMNQYVDEAIKGQSDICLDLSLSIWA